MSIHILRSNNANNSEAQVTVHSVPCTIHADCEAKVKTYFEPYITNEGDGHLTCSFRGYKLNGCKFNLPENYKGVVLHETMKPLTEKQDRKFYVVNNFENFTYWNWDKKTSKNDVMAQAIDWIDIAEALHSPIMEE